MAEFTISTFSYQPEIRHNLMEGIHCLQKQGINVELSEKTKGKFLFLTCLLVNKNYDQYQEQERVLRYQMATKLADLVLTRITYHTLKRILKSKYQHLTEIDNKRILQKADNYLKTLNRDEILDRNRGRQKELIEIIYAYLTHHDLFCLEGFFRFRLKDYFQDLEESVDTAVDSYIVEQDYHEFIKLLRYFLDLQEPRMEEVHVIVKENCDFLILDEEKKILTRENLQRLMFGLSHDLGYDDLLLSALITIAPKRVILHAFAKPELVDTIINVFQERIVFCHGCCLCLGNYQPSENKFLH